MPRKGLKPTNQQSFWKTSVRLSEKAWGYGRV